MFNYTITFFKRTSYLTSNTLKKITEVASATYKKVILDLLKLKTGIYEKNCCFHFYYLHQLLVLHRKIL